MLSSIQVTLIGGPADLQRHVLPDRHMGYFTTAVMPPMQYAPQHRIYPRGNADIQCGEKLICETARYLLREVARDVYVGIYEPLYNR